MNVIDKLACSLGQRSEVPNIELAGEIVKKKDKKAVTVLIGLLSQKNKDIQNDAVKVLYEIGETDPGLISAYLKNFLDLLDHKNNRLQWGAMTAINSIVPEDPDAVYRSLPRIIEAADKGSVITKDNAVNILVRLGALKKYADDSLFLLSEQLKKAFINQLPMYAERMLPLITEKNKAAFIKILRSRIIEIEKESGRKRVEKLIKRIG